MTTKKKSSPLTWTSHFKTSTEKRNADGEGPSLVEGAQVQGACAGG